MKKISLFVLSLAASLFFVSCGDNDSNNPYDPDAPGTSTSQKRLKGVTFSCELDVDYEGKVRYSFNFNNIRYDSEGRIGSVHFEKQRLSEYDSEEQENAQVRISYIGKTISLSPVGGFADTKLANFETNDKGYITKIKGTDGSTDINLEFQYDGNKLVRLIMNGNNYDKLQIDYTWKNNLITKIEKQLSYEYGSYKDEYQSSSEIKYGKNKNKDYIFPINLFFHTVINEDDDLPSINPGYLSNNKTSNEDEDEYTIYYLENVQGYIFNVLGQAGLFGISPELLPISTSTGEYFDYYLDNDGHIIEYVYHPNDKCAPFIATFEYSND